MPAKPRPRKSTVKPALKLASGGRPARKATPKAAPKRATRAPQNTGAKKAPSAKAKWQEHVVAALEDAKALDIVTLDVRKLTDIADYMIVATGTSTRHVSSMANKVVDSLRALGRKPVGIEGQDIGEWVLIDFGDVIAHIMRPQTRDFYNLEKLWAQGLAENGAGAVIELEQHVRQRRKPAS